MYNFNVYLIRFIFLFLVFFFSFKSFAETIHRCERFSILNQGFSSKKAAESWYPKNITIRTNLETEKAYLGSSDKYRSNIKVKSGGQRLDLKFPIRSSGGHLNYLKFYFLPSGEIHAILAHKASFADLGGAKYRCSNWP